MAGSLCPTLNGEFSDLDQRGRVLAEYIWIGGSGQDLRSKTKVLDKAPRYVEDLPIWNYDGSSTGQAPGHDSEVLLKPVKMCPDPFRREPNILVLCETYQPLADGAMRPLDIPSTEKTWGIHGSNSRALANDIFTNPKVKDAQVWFGLEQEYTLFHQDLVTPLGWPKIGYPAPQGQYYCSAGVENAFGRDLVDAHLKACLYAGLKISGINAEVMPAQWEYQIGPCEGIDAADQLWTARYIMQRVAEKYGVVVSLEPKPVKKGDWNGAGCHTNVSTRAMRDASHKQTYTATQGDWKGRELNGAFAAIIEAVEKLGQKHEAHIDVYGKGNEFRLTGKHETADMHTWKYGVADRGASVRIPRESFNKGVGYFEDRRPAANMDPYVVTSMIANTILL